MFAATGFVPLPDMLSDQYHSGRKGPLEQNESPSMDTTFPQRPLTYLDGGMTRTAPAHYTAQRVREIPPPKPSTWSRTSRRYGDSRGRVVPSMPPRGVVDDCVDDVVDNWQYPYRPEMDSTQHQPYKRVPSKLEKSLSMDLLGTRARPSTGPITRTASTPLPPNYYPRAPGTSQMPSERQKGRPQFPSTLQSFFLTTSCLQPQVFHSSPKYFRINTDLVVRVL